MTDSIRVTGGAPLNGEIRVRGAKNFASKAMVAALLGSTPSTLRNVPDIRDVAVVSSLLRLHGAAVDYDVESGVVTVCEGTFEGFSYPPAWTADSSTVLASPPFEPKVLYLVDRVEAVLEPVRFKRHAPSPMLDAALLPS